MTDKRRDSAQDKDKYDGMVKVLSAATTKEDLDALAMLYIFDMSYIRSDICLAMDSVDSANGWGKYAT